MTIQAFIESAVQGGIPRDAADGVNIYELLLNPELWKAVGKVEGWENTEPLPRYWTYEDTHKITLLDAWQNKMHDMIDALAEGKTLEQYLETL